MRLTCALLSVLGQREESLDRERVEFAEARKVERALELLDKTRTQSFQVDFADGHLELVAWLLLGVSKEEVLDGEVGGDRQAGPLLLFQDVGYLVPLLTAEFIQVNLRFLL